MTGTHGVQTQITQADLIRSLRPTEDRRNPTVDNPPDPAEDADLGILQMRSATLQEIQAFEATPVELQGYCKDCGEEIPEKRRQAKPYAVYCVGCQEQHDPKEKRMRRR
jgi:RNA polymerase-binding transcription factor DksA